ncbi:MAG: pyridoxamine kinase [Lachnospiraceae bacterium]|nr:pyridoxamine kinase [Lachnospiraceae bacterium]
MLKKVAAINDLSGAGRCSLTVAIPILSALKVQVYPLPTAVLSNQTGYPDFYIDDFTEKIDNFTYQWQRIGINFDCVYTGFLPNEKQVDKILNFLRVFRKENTLLLVDPVMGDDGEVYPNFGKDLCEKIKELALEADIITPNLTECCILTGADYKEVIAYKDSEKFLDKIVEVGKKLMTGRVKQVVITGIHHREGENNLLVNVILNGKEVHYVKTAVIGGSYSGTGDILASIICGSVVNGKGLVDAVETAVKFINKAIEDTYKDKTDRNDGINFEKYLYMLMEDFQKCQ